MTIIIDATKSGVVGARDAAMNPERIAGIVWARAWTEELMPMISPRWFTGAFFESKLFVFAIVSPVHAEKNGGIRNNSHECVGKKYASTSTPDPMSV